MDLTAFEQLDRQLITQTTRTRFALRGPGLTHVHYVDIDSSGVVLAPGPGVRETFPTIHGLIEALASRYPWEAFDRQSRGRLALLVVREWGGDRYVDAMEVITTLGTA